MTTCRHCGQQIELWDDDIWIHMSRVGFPTTTYCTRNVAGIHQAEPVETEGAES